MFILQITLSLTYSLIYLFSIYVEGNYLKYLNYQNIRENAFVSKGIIKISLILVLKNFYDFGYLYRKRTKLFSSNFTLKSFSIKYEWYLDDLAVILRFSVYFYYSIHYQLYSHSFKNPYMIQVLLKKNKSTLTVF